MASASTEMAQSAGGNTSPFVMHGARDAVASGLVHIEQQVRALELAVAENPALAFDLAKTLVESVCRVVLGERSVAFDEADDLPKLFKTASNHLPLLPASASSVAETRRSLAQTLNGLSTAIQGICELRNQCGFASHGAGVPRPAMESVQALLAAEAADTIVGFLHRVHRQDRTPPPSPRALYDANQAFNDSVDDTHGPIRVFEIELRASEVLFQMEPESYRIYAAEFDEGAEGIEGHAGGVPEAAP
ncbi:MAG: abortive infection family protein [Fimbriimonadaceae bacterium]|nr:abortive infection family protein [Fimbriimonadaceae bacterium]